jgi:hypothetical protein
LRGTIARRSVVHDVEADWVLAHHYLRIHEVSRSKGADGNPEYEAMVFIAWNDLTQQYSCAWLDVLGGLTTESIGVASPKETELPFIFKDEKGDVTLSNIFVYSPKDRAWEWRIDNVEKGVPTEFARVQLTRS